MTGEQRRPLATRQEVADYLGIPYRTLEQWAWKSVGPRYRTIGRHARYDWADVESWLSQQGSGGESA